jgi:hypothetical protein
MVYSVDRELARHCTPVRGCCTGFPSHFPYATRIHAFPARVLASETLPSRLDTFAQISPRPQCFFDLSTRRKYFMHQLGYAPAVRLLCGLIFDESLSCI